MPRQTMNPLNASDVLSLDIDSLISTTSDDYYTPPYIFEALGLTFDLDVSAPKNGISWLPAATHYSIEDDGLTSPWFGKVWMNPPYSKPTPWIDRFIDHKNGICLVPASKSRWFKNVWEAADSALLMPYNLKFVRGNGFAQIQFQTMMFAMGEECDRALRQSGLGSVR